jgi:cation transport regulator ChaC
MLVLFEPKDPRNMRIFRENFSRAIQEYIEAYRLELLSKMELQINFVRKIEDICGIKRAYYFAYGSNMLPERLIERIERYHTAFKAVLPRHKFIYNKKNDGTAKANIEPVDGVEVHGVCFEIDDTDLKILKNYEVGYDQRDIVITTDKGNEEKAVTYISTSTDTSLFASKDYKKIVRKGAEHWGLSKSYVSEYSS